MMEIVDLELEGDDLIENVHFPESVDAVKDVNGVSIGGNDHLPELHESTEPERNQRNGRYNMRKSLAWDSAFFTSAGVLDPEELSSMITKTDKKEKRILPGIQEEISGSTESISTLQSDSLALESGEDDLFLDIRASIQRSSKKASNFTNSSPKIAAMVLDGTTISSPKKEDFVSQNKIPKPGVKKASTLQTVRMSKSQPKPIGKLGSARSLEQDPVQSQAGAIGKTRDTKSVIPRPLKTISSSVPSTAAKRDSVGIGRAKSECESSKQAGSVSSKLTQLPKVSALGGSRKVPPKPVVSSKCTSLSSSMTGSVQSTRSSTSSDSSINTSSGNVAKPTLMTARRNLGKSSNISTGLSGSGSVPKTLSKALPKNKLPASTLSAYVKSTKISSSVSSASSISEWSSVSSTTSSVVNQRSHNTRTNFDTSACRSVDGDNAHLDNVSGQKAESQGNQGAVPTSNTSRKSSTSGTLQAPGKPSGLRLPSPKIGFFDGSTPRTPNGTQSSQSALHSVIPKSGAAASTPTRSSNGKLKNAKFPTPRMQTSLAKMKAGSPKAASPASEEMSHALVKACSISTDENDSSSSSLGVIVSGISETYQEAVKVEAENRVNQVVDEDTRAHDTDISGDFFLNKNMGSGDITTATGEGNYVSGSEYVSQIGDGLINDELHNNSVSTYKATEKDTDPQKCQGEGLAGDETGTYQKNHKPDSQLLIDTSECVLSSTAAASDALKNISYSDECVDTPKELVIQGAVAENTGFALPFSESNQIGDGLTRKPMNSVPTSEGIDKNNEPANCHGEGLTGEKRGTYPKNYDPNSQLLSIASECVLPSAAASDAAAHRSPFALKNFSYSDECVDKPIENTGFALPSSGSEYISQIKDGLIGDELEKISTPVSGALEKENNPAVYQLKEGLTGENEGANQKNLDPKHQLVIDTSEGLLSSPFARKNSSSSKVIDKPMEPVIEVALAESAGFTLPSSEERDDKIAESNS